MPTPGIAVSRARSPRSIGANEFLRLDAREHRQRDFRTDAADADQPLEELLLEQRREAVKQERILADVGMDAQRDRRARLAEPVERRQRHEHVIADAVDVDHDAVRMFFEDRCREDARSRSCGLASPERGRRDGGPVGAPARRPAAGRLHRRRTRATAAARARGRWRRPARRRRRAATAPDASPSSSLIMCCTCGLSARP